MTKVTVELYTEQSNYAIIKLPKRKFPGVVFQGDSLFTLYSRISDIFKKILQSKDKEVIDEITEIQNLLNDLVQHYENTLYKNNIELPYNNGKK